MEYELIDRGQEMHPTSELFDTDVATHLMKVALRLAEDGLEYGEVR